MRKFFLCTLCCLTALFVVRAGNPATVIVQVSDPQMGFYHDNRDMVYETAMLTRTVEAINRLAPDAVVFTGDYVHDPKDDAQWTEFLRIAATISPRIKVLYVPGNHDMLRSGGSVDLTPYTRRLGADRFCERRKGVLLTGINSTYIRDELADASKEREQFDWLSRSLTRKKRRDVSLVFAHHPFFLEQIDEVDTSTIAPEKRCGYFALFKREGVHTVFAGHHHDNAGALYDGVNMITTSAVGRQLGGAESGVRIITVRRGEVHHRYYPLDELPANRAALLPEGK